MRTIRDAVILAAGAGRRISAHIPEVPKGFIELEGAAIVRRSLALLKAAGVERIVVVTGYRSEYYERLREENPRIMTVHNAAFAESGSMYSLYLARDLMRDEFLLLESDLVYEQRSLAALLAEKRDNAVLISGRTDSGDEVYVDARGDRVCNISKDRTIIEHSAGELVGITLVSPTLFRAMVVEAEARFRSSLEVAYETDVIAAVSRTMPVYYNLVEDLAWTEIDNAEHLARASRMILPRIHEADARFAQQKAAMH